MTLTFSTHRSATSRDRQTFRPQAERLEGRQLLAAGALDLSFNSTGYVLAGPLSAQAVTIQPLNGDILATGEIYPTSTGGDFRVVALTPSGALDSSFGSGGSVTTDFAGKEDRPQAMAVMPDGRFVVAGWADTGTGKVKGLPVTNYDLAVARYLPGGSLDTSFGTGGKVTTNISTYSTTDTFNKRDEANAVVIQDDGKIVVGGYSYTPQGTTEGVLVRYNTDGTLDTSFGQGGVVQINLPNFTSDGVWGLAIWRDPTTGTDKIVTMEAPKTSSGYSVGVARYNLDGSLDTSFGTNGRTVTTVPGASLGGWGMALQSDGSVVVTGYYQYTNGTPQDTFLLRYTAAGALDSTFGNNGIAVFDAGGSDVGYSVAIQPSDGKILVAGYSSLTNGSAFVARFQTGGTIDTTFGSNGEALNTFSNAGSSFHGLAVQSDGRIVAVGGAASTSGKTTTNNFLIARFLGDTTTLTAAGLPRAIASTTAPTSQGTSPQIPLAPPTDQDLTALATELIGAGKKRRGRPVS
jgi:uncharacterized delta-60 repeat protein